MKRSPIDRRRALTGEEFIQEYERPGKPVILEGLTDAWLARQRWSCQDFCERFGSVRVQLSHPNDYGRAAEGTIAELSRRMAEPGPDEAPVYLKSWDFRPDCPELVEDFEVPPMFSDDWLEDLPERLRPSLLWIFMGPAGSGSEMHVDVGFTAAWNTQVTGRKHWVMFAPDQERHLYAGRVDAFKPDLRRFRLFEIHPFSRRRASLACVEHATLGRSLPCVRLDTRINARTYARGFSAGEEGPVGADLALPGPGVGR